MFVFMSTQEYALDTSNEFSKTKGKLRGFVSI